MPKRVLIVGAGGFIGGFLAAEGLRRDLEVWAVVRETTSRRYLDDERLKFIVVDFDNRQSIVDGLDAALPPGQRWDWIIYNLGATKCANFLDFNRINFGYLRTFIEALREARKIPSRMIYISSLSALGPGDEKGYTPLDEKMVPDPNTRYGLSKIKAESFLETNSDIPWIIFRPTGVYGPHEKDYLMMVKAIDRHFDFGVGYKKQMLTFIYVEDLARAAYDALERAPIHRKYIISEPKAYTQTEFRKIVAEALGRRAVIPVRLPLWMAYAASVTAEKWGKITMKPSTLNRDKFKIMRQRNWACDISAAVNDWQFAPEVDLRHGIDAVVRAYRDEKKGGGK